MTVVHTDIEVGRVEWTVKRVSPVSSMSPRVVLLWFAVIIATSSAAAQSSRDGFHPQVGQPGKDVIWVPSSDAVVSAMLNTAKVSSNDYLIDLGSGDGRTVIAAARRGAKALGIEYNPQMVELSRANAERAGVSSRASFVVADLFNTDFSQATVLTMFLLPDINLRLRPRILEMRPWARVVSNTFDMGDWRPDQTVQVRQGCKSYCKVLLWIVPAKVEGTWRVPEGELRLSQRYQSVSGTLTSRNLVAPVVNGRLRGDEITFDAAGIRYTGRVSRNVIHGSSRRRGKDVPWRAVALGT